jgi:hypothetical protein
MNYQEHNVSVINSCLHMRSGDWQKVTFSDHRAR